MVKKIVEGSNLDDIIALGYTDSEGDQVTDRGQKIRAFDGDDVVAAGGGDDIAWGGDGNDVMLGQTGNDRLNGESGDDWLRGGEGNDRLIAGKGNDTLDGGADDDMLWGNKGNNLLQGGDGNDTIEGGDQASIMEGGDGNDVLLMRAKKGADHTATGGDDADTFVFALLGIEAQADLTITDFALGEDTFTAEGVQDALYLMFLDETAVTDVEGDAVLTLTTGDTVRFEGITEAEFETFYGLGPTPAGLFATGAPAFAPAGLPPFEFTAVKEEPVPDLDDGFLFF